MAAVTARFALLGTGNSTGVPWLRCVIDRDASDETQLSRKCHVCSECVTNPNSRNRRNNPSALVSFRHPDGRMRHILIDVGKTFRDTVQRNFPALGVDHLDAVILTHPHMDAIGGLDDLRDISPRGKIPVYLTQGCYDVVNRAFSYLTRAPPVILRASGDDAEEEGDCVADATSGPSNRPSDSDGCCGTPTAGATSPASRPGSGSSSHSNSSMHHHGGHGTSAAVAAVAENKGKTFIADLQWNIISPWQPFEVEGLLVVPFPVEHGAPGPMLGFEFCFVSSSSSDAAGTAAGSGRSAAKKQPDAPSSSDCSASDSRSVSSSTASESAGINKSSDNAPAAHKSSAVDGVASASAALNGLSIQPTCHAAQRIVYISDIVALPADTRAFLLDGRRIDLLVLDALSYKNYPTHFGFKQAVACALDLRAAGQTVFVGMNHRVDYYVENDKLAAFGAQRGVALELGYDGWNQSYRLASAGTLTSVSAHVRAARARWRNMQPPRGVRPVPHLQLNGLPSPNAPVAVEYLEPDEVPSTLPPSAESAADAASHAPVAYTYNSAVLPVWEDGQSPSLSASIEF